MKTPIKFRGKLDPFYENELLAARAEETMDKDDSLRFTKTKAIFRKPGWSDSEGDDEIVFQKSTGDKARGTFEIKICTWQHVQRESHKRCDAGHSHPVLVVETIWLERIKVTREEGRRLARWILEEPE